MKSTGQCAPLLTADCPLVYGDYHDDHAILLGTLLGKRAGEATFPALEASAFLAAEEINSAAAGGGLPPPTSHGAVRPLVIIGCNSSINVLTAARHLIDDLHVPAIVGPTAGEDVVDVTQQISAKAGTLIMTPTSQASSISNLADNDLTWRDIPSDSQRAKLVIDQMAALERLLRATRGLTTVKLGIVHRTDALGLSARDSIGGKLIINGLFINDAANAGNVSLDSYPPGDASSLSTIAAKYAQTFRPDILFITAPEQVASFLVPLEQALTASRVVDRPYYVCTDAAKTQAFLDAVAAATLPADVRRRVRGIGVRPDVGSAAALESFGAAFTARYGHPPSALMTSSAYDALYAIAYAIAATPDMAVTGASVAHGLRALGVGDAVAVGAKDAGRILMNLAAGRSISLRGTFGPLQWDPSGDIAGGTVEVWCIGTAAGAPAFGSSGLTMDVQTQVIGGAFVQCQ